MRFFENWSGRGGGWRQGSEENQHTIRIRFYIQDQLNNVFHSSIVLSISHKFRKFIVWSLYGHCPQQSGKEKTIPESSYLSKEWEFGTLIFLPVSQKVFSLFLFSFFENSYSCFFLIKRQINNTAFNKL